MSRARKRVSRPRPRQTRAPGPSQSPSWLLLALEGRALLEWAAFCMASPLLRTAPAGDGHPVLVLPGLMTDDRATWPLRHFLHQLGYAVHPWQLGLNRGPQRGLQRRLRQRLLRLADAHGAPVSLVGWSLGGLFARALAARESQAVRAVITLGSPLSADAHATNVRRVFEWASGRRADDPALRRMLGAHPPVPVTSILSRSDGIVHWRASLTPTHPRAESIEVPASHLGMNANPAVLWLVAERLAQHPRRWRRFDCSAGWRSLLYGDACAVADGEPRD